MRFLPILLLNNTPCLHRQTHDYLDTTKKMLYTADFIQRATAPFLVGQ